ncbi:DUF551 domain-containing protein [Enterobacter hormaechei]|uniref:DUF551 domain-containing protein n=1 Tax=Enterobacter hormaechei TaxID=158836 RepID=UPI0038CFAE43
MSTITKERVANLLQFNSEGSDCQANAEQWEVHELARIALASLEAEPVGEIVLGEYDDCGCHPDARVACIAADGQADWENFKDGTRLYTAPPAPVSVPAAMEMDDDFDSAFEHGKAVGWNAYRAAMLQSFGNSEQLNSPVIQDGWVACVERMPSAGEQVLAYRPDAPESNDPLIKMATYVGGSAHGHGFDCYCKPTHWMPLPAAPQQEA